MDVRPAAPADADAMSETVAQGLATYRSFAPPGWNPPPEAADAAIIRAKVENPGVWSMVAEDGGAMAAHCVFFDSVLSTNAPSAPGLAHLWHLFVREPYWGAGVATDLLARATAAAREQGFTEMRLATPEQQARGRRFYEREGWQLVAGPFDSPIGLVLVEYRVEL